MKLEACRALVRVLVAASLREPSWLRKRSCLRGRAYKPARVPACVLARAWPCETGAADSPPGEFARMLARALRVREGAQAEFGHILGARGAYSWQIAGAGEAEFGQIQAPGRPNLGRFWEEGRP